MKKYKKILLLLLALIIAPISVYAGDYNVTDEDDRATVQNIIPGTTFDSGNSYMPSVGVRTPMKTNDTFYFLNTNDWTSVSIYIYQKSSGNAPSGGAWPGFAMTNTGNKINGHDVYSFTYTGTDELYDNMVFSGLNSSNARKQTINLAFLESGIYYHLWGPAESNGKYAGEWFVYDKTKLNSYVTFLNTIISYSDSLTTTTRTKLSDLKTEATALLAQTDMGVTFYDYVNTLHVREDTNLVYEIITELNQTTIDVQDLKDAIEAGEAIDQSRLDDATKQELNDKLTAARNMKTILENQNQFSLNMNSPSSQVSAQISAFVGNIQDMNIALDNLNNAVDDANTYLSNHPSNNNNSNVVDDSTVIDIPQTGDGIINATILFIISMGGLIITRKIQKKYN